MHQQKKLSPSTPEVDEVLYFVMRHLLGGGIRLDVAAAGLLSAACACLAHSAHDREHLEDALDLYAIEIGRLGRLNWQLRIEEEAGHGRLH